MTEKEYCVSIVENIINGYKNKGKRLSDGWPIYGSPVSKYVDNLLGKNWNFKMVNDRIPIDKFKALIREVLQDNERSRKHSREDIIKYMVNRLLTVCRAKLHEAYAAESNNVREAGTYDRDADIYIKGVPFDIKSTRIKKEFPMLKENVRSSKNVSPEEVKELVNAYYEEQGGKRYNEQNRLFIVEVPYNDTDSEYNLTANTLKEEAYIKEFCDNFSHRDDLTWENKAYWRVLFLCEDANHEIHCLSY